MWQCLRHFLAWELGDYPEGQGEHPVTGVSWYEAAAYAAFVGKALPNMYQWSRAAGTYLTHYIVPVSNFRNAGTVAVATVGAIGPYGTHDMAGNAKEWCRNPLKDGRRFVLGGGWNEPSYMFNDADAQDPFTRGPSYGFRLVKPLDDRTSAEASGVIPLAERDYTKETPVPPEIGRAYLRLYAYDRGPLEARTEEMDDTSDRWRKEKVSFTAAYGRERVSAYLLTPRSGQPPYPVVVFFPGSNAIQQRSSKDLPGMRLLAPILRSGRAVLYPIYKSTFERGDGLGSDYQAPTTFYRDHVIMSLEVAVPARALPRFPARDALVLELCLSYEDADDAGPAAKEISTCVTGAPPPELLALSDVFRRGIRPRPPAEVQTVEGRPGGWVGYNGQVDPKWVLGDRPLNEQSLRLMTELESKPGAWQKLGEDTCKKK